MQQQQRNLITNLIKQSMVTPFKQCPLDLQADSRLKCVSLSLISLLVFATLVIVTILAFNPIIMLNIAQIKHGQRDFIIKPKNSHFNTTRITQIAGLVAMPRFRAEVSLGQKRALAWFINFDLEKQQGLGKLGAGLPQGHRFAIMHQSLGFTEGQQITVQIDDNQTLSLIIELVQNRKLEMNQQFGMNLSLFKETQLRGSFLVKEVFDDPAGKMGSSQATDCIFLDIRYAMQQMAQQTFPLSHLSQLMEKTSTRLADIATQTTINLPDRIYIYNNANMDQVLRDIQTQGQKIIKDIGFLAVRMEMPIAGQFQMLQYFGLFIGVMLKSIIASLFLLSVLMLDSTIQMGVDRQRADLSILKVIGANRTYVGGQILSGALRQVLIANLIAYPFAYFTFGIIESAFSELLGHKIEVGFTLYACASGAFIGFLVPIVASISPIKNIIRNDLVQGLGSNKPNYSQLKTQIYVDGQQFPWGKVTFGFLGTFYGLVIYYLLPKAMIELNLGLMITLFFIFLQGLLVGLLILSYSFQYILESALARLLLFWSDRTDFALTVKNLSCHRLQNRKTSVIYAMAVSFVIMIAVGFQLQIDATRDEYMQVMAGDIDIGGKYVNPQFIHKILPKLPGIESVTFLARDLMQAVGTEIEMVMASDKAKLFFLPSPIYGIAGSFLPINATNGRQVLYTDSHPPYNIYTYLETEQGEDTCTLGEYVANKFGIIQSNNHEFLINIYFKDRVKRIPMNYSSILSKRKGLFYYPFAFPESQIGVSIATYKKLSGLSSEQIPYFRAKLYVKDPSLLPEIVSTIWQQVRSNSELDQHIDFVWNRGESDQTFTNLKKIIDTIMMLLLTLLLILCFFSLMTTTHANIHNQRREIGVLLMLGYEKNRIMRVYIYEAFFLVANSCIKGFVVGYIVATFMAWQRELFSSVIVNLSFKAEYLFVIFAFAVGSSILATRRALIIVLDSKISDLLCTYN